ncbi:glutamate-cysteine ligase family protein [Actinoplanes sp. NPDC004185]
MISLTEPAAELLVAEHAFTPGLPGFVGLSVDLLLDEPGLPESLVGSLRERPPLRHGLLGARSARIAVVSGPPSPGIDVVAERMTEDLPMPHPLIAGHRIAVLAEAADAVDPANAAGDTYATATAGIRVALEAGVDGDGPFGLRRRWNLAHAVAPVLAAAFANAPLRHGRPSGWRSTRQALRRGLPSAPPTADPRGAWTGLVLDAPVAGTGRTLRAWSRSGPGDRPTITDLTRHLDSLRPPVAARGHLVLDVADRQPGNGWRVPLAVIAALLDDPQAATEAEAATRALAGTPRPWERAARDALTDPELAAVARECFVAAYASLSRQGVSRELRDAVADFTERYVLRGRCPADDVLDRATARP